MSAEAPIRAESREELVYLLSQASELEHGLMCEYLFAMFSLKRQAKEGPSADQLEAAGRWDRMISRVAAQEMLHLAQTETGRRPPTRSLPTSKGESHSEAV